VKLSPNHVKSRRKAEKKVDGNKAFSIKMGAMSKKHCQGTENPNVQQKN
jgi:hypothetical protein